MKETSGLEQKLRDAEARVSAYLAQHGGELPTLKIVLEPDLEEGTLATHRYPGTVAVREPSLPESVVAHELVHIAQGTLAQFRGFRLFYTLLAEGLADWVIKILYPEHQVKYQAGHRLVACLVRADEGIVSDLVRLHELRLVPEDVDDILTNPRLPNYTRDLLGRMAGRIRESIQAAVEAGITDPTFVTLGEELRAWKFLLDDRFSVVREDVDEVVGAWFGEVET